MRWQRVQGNGTFNLHGIETLSVHVSAGQQSSRFTILQVFGLITFSGLLIGVITIGLRARTEKRELLSRLSSIDQQNQELEAKLRSTEGDALRSRFAEKLLYYVVSSKGEYPELMTALENYQTRKMGLSMHPLDEDDNRAYLCFYAMDVNAGPPFSTAFLVQEEPFSVVEHLTGEQPRMARRHEEKWVFGSGMDGEDRWFIIEEDGFVPFTGDESSDP